MDLGLELDEHRGVLPCLALICIRLFRVERYQHYVVVVDVVEDFLVLCPLGVRLRRLQAQLLVILWRAEPQVPDEVRIAVKNL